MPLSAPTPSTAAPRGIDLAKRYVEIRKIISKHFSSKCAGAGIDVDDLIQEVAFKLHRAAIRVRDADDEDEGSVYEPSRGSFSHFIFYVAGNQLKTMVIQNQRHPLSDLDVAPDVEDERLDPAELLIEREAAEIAAKEGSDVDDEDDDQILIAATCVDAHADLGSAVAAIRRRQVEPRPPRRPVPPIGSKRVQMSFLDEAALGKELVNAVVANNNASMEIAS